MKGGRQVKFAGFIPNEHAVSCINNLQQAVFYEASAEAAEELEIPVQSILVVSWNSIINAEAFRKKFRIFRGVASLGSDEHLRIFDVRCEVLVGVSDAVAYLKKKH